MTKPYINNGLHAQKQWLKESSKPVESDSPIETLQAELVRLEERRAASQALAESHLAESEYQRRRAERAERALARLADESISAHVNPKAYQVMRRPNLSEL